MSFFRVIGGQYAAGEYRDVKVANDGSVYTIFTDDSPSGKIDRAIQVNAAFMVTDHVQVPKGGFYTLFVTVPDDTSKLFYVDWSMSTQREGKLKVIEDAVSVGTPSSKTLRNRNRNSSATSAVTAGRITNTAGTDPETSILGNTGVEIYRHYFPRDVDPYHPVGGRLILQNNTVYAFKLDSALITPSDVSFRMDLSEIVA